MLAVALRAPRRARACPVRRRTRHAPHPRVHTGVRPALRAPPAPAGRSRTEHHRLRALRLGSRLSARRLLAPQCRSRRMTATPPSGSWTTPTTSRCTTCAAASTVRRLRTGACVRCALLLTRRRARARSQGGRGGLVQHGPKDPRGARAACARCPARLSALRSHAQGFASASLTRRSRCSAIWTSTT